MATKHANTALLVMDMQQNILGNFRSAETLRPNVLKALQYARGQQIKVIYVVVALRQGAPEVSENNKVFRMIMERPGFATGKLPDIDTMLTPLEHEPIVVKRRYSAFTGSDLEVLLGAAHIEHMVLAGVSTSGVVLSTVREAADKDYRLTVLSDCCGDRDEEVHTVLMNKVFPVQAEVLRCEEWVGA